jgi:hypothetical protein
MRVNMGTYFAGQPTTAIQMPQTGTATYNTNRRNL